MAIKFNATKAVREKIFVKLALMGSSGCVDADTEFFNGKKWKRIADYEIGDKVLEYDKFGNAVLSYPIKYHKIPCNKLWHFETEHELSQCLSEEHNVLYVNSNGNLVKKKFADIKSMHENSIHGFTGKFITTFNYSGKGIDLSDEEIELMCAAICNGVFLDNINKCKFHIKNDREKTYLKEILNKCSLEFSEDTTDFCVNIPRNEKEFTDYWYNCNRHQLGLICENILFWNGNLGIVENSVENVENFIKGVENSVEKKFSTTSKQTADFIQFAFSSCGLRTDIDLYKNGQMYTVRIFNNSLVELDSDVKVEIKEYQTKDGYKYCFTMPTSNLILRRNNKIFVTGNSGKTYSALRIASGMAEAFEKNTGKKAKILLGNTENGRGRYYANEFDYDLVDLEAPYNPELYVDFIKYAIDKEYDILILDSTSPEWEGRGGCLDLHQQAGGKYQDWSKVTPRHDKFISAIANSPIHIIATMRGKDQYEVEKDDRGKVSVKKLGVGAKQREGFEYEFTSTFMLDRDTNLAKAQKDNTHIFEYDPMVKLTEEHGVRIMEWANSGEGYTPQVVKLDDKVVIDEVALDDKKNEINTLINSLKEYGISREAIADTIKANHSVNGKPSANYNSIKSVDVADNVLFALNKLIVIDNQEE